MRVNMYLIYRCLSSASVVIHLWLIYKLQWNPAITKCYGTENFFVIAGSEDPIITNYLVKSKNILYSRVTKLDQAEQWDIHDANQCTDLHVNSYI